MDSLVFTNAVITVILSLQVAGLGVLLKHERRISRMEDDLYVDPKNPASIPLTKRISDLADDLQHIKSKLENLEGKLTEVEKILQVIKDG
ncbi:MAG: hypothetical protein DRN03_00340 [Thermoplasmata archaeon]|nr:MAG: hypothetical protein DRN03_00340 [Thermoplasmata archaeon]